MNRYENVSEIESNYLQMCVFECEMSALDSLFRQNINVSCVGAVERSQAREALAVLGSTGTRQWGG